MVCLAAAGQMQLLLRGSDELASCCLQAVSDMVLHVGSQVWFECLSVPWMGMQESGTHECVIRLIRVCAQKLFAAALQVMGLLLAVP